MTECSRLRQVLRAFRMSWSALSLGAPKAFLASSNVTRSSPCCLCLAIHSKSLRTSPVSGNSIFILVPPCSVFSRGHVSARLRSTACPFPSPFSCRLPTQKKQEDYPDCQFSLRFAKAQKGISGIGPPPRFRAVICGHQAPKAPETSQEARSPENRPWCHQKQGSRDSEQGSRKTGSHSGPTAGL